MNMAVDDSRLGNDEYSFAMNVRNRFGELKPVRRPLSIDAGLTANQRCQGIYTIGDFILIFQNGNAKFKHRLADTWTVLWDADTLDSPDPGSAVLGSVNLQLDTSVDFIYVQAVPCSYQNFAKKHSHSIGGDPWDDLEGMVDESQLTDRHMGLYYLSHTARHVTRSPAAIVVQDGINQPNLIVLNTNNIESPITVRKCQTYADWYNGPPESGNREYVPIGKQMMYFAGKLFVVSSDVDGNYTQILHSVTGRPLDFMIPLDGTGNKLKDNFSDSVVTTFGGELRDDVGTRNGAHMVSYSVSYDPITCIAPLNTDSFFVGTRSASYAVTLDYTHTLFAEPTFTKKYLFGSSAINQFSFVDTLGDFAFIDSEGLRSFNAVQQLRNEGRNSAFSLKVAKLFEGKIQNFKTTAAITFDNYAFFAVDTTVGHGVLVYDTTLQKFVSFDSLVLDDDTTCAPIVQFTKIESATAHELYAVTNDGKFIKMWNGIKYAPSFVQTKAFNTGDSRVDQKPVAIRTLFTDVKAVDSAVIRIPAPATNPASSTANHIYHDGSGTGNSVSTTTTSSSPITVTVEKLPYTLAVGTVIRFYGASGLTGYSIPNDLDAGLDGTFELTSQANVGATSIVGKLTTSSFVHWNSPGIVRYDGSGTVRCMPISNGLSGQAVVSKTIPAPTFEGIKYTGTYPVLWNGDNSVYSLNFLNQGSRTGWKIAYTIEWDNAASLSILNIDTTDVTSKNSLMTQAYGS
tara:strand:- start:414 stop:2630 length:2217 start_codon:yes stop_codon:yes gene_type:complete